MNDPLNKLAEEAMNGNREAWHDLYSKLTPGLLRLLRARVSETDAEEIVLLTWERVFLKQHTFDPTRSFRNWVFAITMNAYRDRIRLAKTRPVASSDAGWSDLIAAQPNDEEDLEAQVKKLVVCLEALERNEREIIRFRFWEGQTHREIAEVYGLRTSQIRSKCHRTIHKLARCMGFETSPRI